MPGIENLGFGCVSLTSHALLKNAEEILSVAFDNGITHFDTAPLYGKGYSEKILGKFLKRNRETVTVATKFGLGSTIQSRMPVQAALILNAVKNKVKKKQAESSSNQMLPAHHRSIEIGYVKQSLQNSLQNLQTDYIDYYLLHEAHPSFLTKEALAFLQEQKQNGVLRNLGIAAASVNLNGIYEEQLKGFEILQYESDAGQKTSDLLERFSNKIHFYHSVLKFLKLTGNRADQTELAGMALARASKVNPSGKVLFSTVSKKRLRANIESFIRFHSLSPEELTSRFNAIHQS